MPRTELEVISDWVKYYQQSPLNYQMSALIAVYKNDGEVVLRKVLKALGLEHSADLVKDAVK